MRSSLPLVASALLAAAPAGDVMTLSGLGPLRIGTPAAELRDRFRAVPGEPYPDPEVDCAHWTSPLFPGIQMMVSGGRLVRIETRIGATGLRAAPGSASPSPSFEPATGPGCGSSPTLIWGRKANI